MTLRLRPYQQVAVGKFVERIHKVERGGLIVMPTGCLAGDAVIQTNRGGNGRKYTLETLVRKFSGQKFVGAAVWNPGIPTMVSRAEGEVVKSGQLSGAWYSGMKVTYKLTTITGRSIRGTLEHPFLTDCGWAKLGDLQPGSRVQVVGHQKMNGRKPKNHYRYKQGMEAHPYAVRFTARRIGRRDESLSRVAYHRLVAEASINKLGVDQYIRMIRRGDVVGLQFLDPETYHVHHKDENHLNNSPGNLEVLEASEHLRMHSRKYQNNVLYKIAYEEVVSVDAYGEEPTYDLSVHDDPHNFAANGFIVHNSGKSACLAAIAQWWLEHGKGGVGIISHRVELMRQNAEEFEALTGITCYREQGSEHRIREGDWDRVRLGGVVSFTVQTLQNRRMQRVSRDAIGLLLVDECHRIRDAGQYCKVAEYFGCKWVGLTATPDRTDGQPLVGPMFDECWYGGEVGPDGKPTQQVDQFIEDGWLVPLKVRHVHVSSLQWQWLRKRSGKDFTAEQVQKVWQDKQAIYQFVQPILQEVGQRKTLYFCPGVPQAHDVAAVVNGLAYPRKIAEYVASYQIDGDNNRSEYPKDRRRQILRRFARPEDDLRHVANMGVFTEGTNVPIIGAIGWLRFTKSRLLLAQGAGRAFRTWPGTLDGLEDATPQQRREAIARSPKPFALFFDPAKVTGRLTLCHAIDLFSPGSTPELRRRCAEIVAKKSKSNESFDPREVLAEAKELESPFFKGLKAALLEICPQVDYRLVEVDPFTGRKGAGHAPVGTTRSGVIDAASEKQKRLIRCLAASPFSDEWYDKLGRKSAGAVIDKLLQEPCRAWILKKIPGKNPRNNKEGLAMLRQKGK